METRQSVHFAITNILTESETLRDSAPKLLQTVCEGLGWELGELWTVDATVKQLRLETLWHAPSLDASEFEKDSRAFTFPMGNGLPGRVDRKSTRLNSSHSQISYAVFCLKK